MPVIKDFDEHNLSEEELKHKQKTEYDQYLLLFARDARSAMKLSNKYITKSQHSYFCFNYEQAYKIVVYKVNLREDAPLDNIFEFKKSMVQESQGIYSGYEMGNVEFGYSTAHDSLIKKLYIIYDGYLSDKTKIGDSIVNYNIHTEKLSVRREINGIDDLKFIYKNKNIFSQSHKKLSMNILLYKKGTSVFIITMYSRNNNDNVGTFLLPSLLQGVSPGGL